MTGRPSPNSVLHSPRWHGPRVRVSLLFPGRYRPPACLILLFSNAASLRVLRVLSLFVFAVSLSACASDPNSGYAFTSTYPSNVRSVAVPVFDNYTYATGVEIELTEAIIKEFQRATPIAVTREGSADSELRGVVREVKLRDLANDSITGLAQALSYKLTVDFEWRDSRSGKTIVERRNFSTADVFVPARQTGERIEAGEHAAVQRLARDIVSELRTAW